MLHRQSEFCCNAPTFAHQTVAFFPVLRYGCVSFVMFLLSMLVWRSSVEQTIERRRLRFSLRLPRSLLRDEHKAKLRQSTVDTWLGSEARQRSFVIIEVNHQISHTQCSVLQEHDDSLICYSAFDYLHLTTVVCGCCCVNGPL